MNRKKCNKRVFRKKQTKIISYIPKNIAKSTKICYLKRKILYEERRSENA